MAVTVAPVRNTVLVNPTTQAVTVLSAASQVYARRQEVVRYYMGQAVDEDTFGSFYVPSARRLLEVQIEAQTAPAGAALTVDATVGGVEQGKIATLAAGATFQRTDLSANPLELAAGQTLGLKIKSIGSSTPGSYLTVTLVFGSAAGANPESASTARRGTVAVTTGAESVAITFSTPLASAPSVVLVSAWAPDAVTDLVAAYVQEDTITANGFTARLDGPAPAGAKLSYEAHI